MNGRVVLFTLTSTLCLLVLFPINVMAKSGGTDPEAVAKLMEGLASGSCSVRWLALKEYLRSSDKWPDRLRDLQQRVPTIDNGMKAKLSALIDFLAQSTKANSKNAPLMSRLRRISKIQDETRRAAELDRMRRQLLDTINNPKEDFPSRLQATSFMAVMATEFAPGLTAPWGGDLRKLLESGDRQVRLVGSVIAARGRLSKGQEPEKALVIPVLIGGLKGGSFGEGYYSQGALFDLSNLTPERLCVDPTDPGELRADGVRGWEEWWTENKGKLSGEKVRQLY